MRERRWSVAVGSLGIAGAVSLLGCDGLLGLGGKTFDDTSSSSGSGGSGAAGGTGATGGSGAGTGATGGSGTSATGGSGAGGTGAGGGSTGTGGNCGNNPIGEVTDEFDFGLCGVDSITALISRGWHFTRSEESYPANTPYQGALVANGKFYSGTADTLYWFNGKKGLLTYKPISGDFLVVTKAAVARASSDALPDDEQAGAGIMARDPAGAVQVSGQQRWIAVDRGVHWDDVAMMPKPWLYGSWQKADDEALSTPTDDDSTGLIALCRVGSTFEIWAVGPDGHWASYSDLIAGAPAAEMPSTLQVGLFVYAYNNGPDSPDGVRGIFDFVQQVAPDGDCDPGKHGIAPLTP